MQRVTTEIALTALHMAVNFADCPLENCEYVNKDCNECKVNFWLDAARRIHEGKGEGKRD